MIDIAGNRTVRDLLRERAQRHPDKSWLVFEDRDGATTEFTYAQFLDRVRAAAAGLAKAGIGKGDAVVVHLPNCPEFLFAWFGLAWIGAVFVPSNVANTTTELRHVIQHSDAVAVITAEPYRSLFDEVLADAPAPPARFLARSLDVAAGWESFAALLATTDTPPENPIEAEDLAELIFTSGTTASPKAVMLTHANLLHAGEREWRGLGLDTTDRCLTALPLFHVNAQSITTLSALTVGGTLVLLEEYRATRFWEQVRRHQATMLSVVGMQVRTLLAQPEGPDERDHTVRRVMFALNVLDEEKEAFERRFAVELINGYGLSEAMTLVSLAPVHGAKRWPSIGLPLLDRLIRVIDDTGNDTRTGEIGEIVVWGVPGRSLMKGYYKDPDATAAAIRDGWLRTGDNGYLDEAGYLHFFDRRKDMIKTAGENVSASEVERVLLTHPQIAEAAVIGVPHPIRDEVVMAFVVPTPGADLTIDSVVAHCRDHLAKFKVPATVQLCDALPKTSIGKVEKKALRAAANAATTS